MRHIVSISCILILAACSPYPDSSNFSSNEHDEITDIADDVAYDAILDSERITELEARIDELEETLNITSDLALSVAKDNDALAKTVSNNAATANENSLKNMKQRAAERTARGECGSEFVQAPNGVWQNRLIPCPVGEMLPVRK